MAKKDETFTPVVRRREIMRPETGPSGTTTTNEVVYEFGFEVEGAFVRLGGTTQPLVDAAIKRHGYTADDGETSGNGDDASGSSS